MDGSRGSQPDAHAGASRRRRSPKASLGRAQANLLIVGVLATIVAAVPGCGSSASQPTRGTAGQAASNTSQAQTPANSTATAVSAPPGAGAATTSDEGSEAERAERDAPLPGEPRPFTATECPPASAVRQVTGVNVHSGGADDPLSMACGYIEEGTKEQDGAIPYAFQTLNALGYDTLQDAYVKQERAYRRMSKKIPGIDAGVRAAPEDFGGGAFEAYIGAPATGFHCQVWLIWAGAKIYPVVEASSTGGSSVDAACANAEKFARLLY